MELLIGFLLGVALLAAVGALTVVYGMRRERLQSARARRLAQRRREQPATLEGGGSHLSADRRR